MSQNSLRHRPLIEDLVGHSGEIILPETAAIPCDPWSGSHRRPGVLPACAEGTDVSREPWSKGENPLPIVGRFPDLDRLSSGGQDPAPQSSLSAAGTNDPPSEPQGTSLRHDRWLNPKLSARVLGGAGLFLLMAAIVPLLLPSSENSDKESNAGGVSPAPTTASAAAIPTPKNDFPVCIDRVNHAPEKTGTSSISFPGPLAVSPDPQATPAATAAGKTPVLLQEKVGTEVPRGAPVLQTADRRSGVSDGAPSVAVPPPKSPPASGRETAPAQPAESNTDADFVPWPRSASDVRNSGNPPSQPTPRTNTSPLGGRMALRPPPTARAGIMQNPYFEPTPSPPPETSGIPYPVTDRSSGIGERVLTR
ncbi:MAG: hypothetical protein JXB10_08570 [Pirellulales bacterium]|nr:hypothetical protein [Pirellulales bacterium]